MAYQQTIIFLERTFIQSFCSLFRLWMCTFTLAVSGGAVLLLPVSIFANEVLIHYPESYYWKWVHSELIQGEYVM